MKLLISEKLEGKNNEVTGVILSQKFLCVRTFFSIISWWSCKERPGKIRHDNDSTSDFKAPFKNLKDVVDVSKNNRREHDRENQERVPEPGRGAAEGSTPPVLRGRGNREVGGGRGCSGDVFTQMYKWEFDVLCWGGPVGLLKGGANVVRGGDWGVLRCLMLDESTQ